MNNEEHSKKKTSFNWGTALTGAIILFIVTTLSVVAYLVSLDYYVVDENYYEKAEKYQQHIDQVKHASTMEQPVEIKLVANKQIMAIVFPSSVPMNNISGTIELYRPSDSALDKNLKLALDENYSQRIATDSLTKGKWIVKVQWSANNKKYFTEKDIFL